MPSELRLQCHMSLAGYMAGPNYSMDWLVNIDWDPAMKDFINSVIMNSVVGDAGSAQAWHPSY